MRDRRIWTVLAVVPLLMPPLVLAAPGFDQFVTRQGDKLMEGEREYRFISFNIPNLHYIEDNLRFEESNPWRLPDEFEIRDALASIRQMNGRAEIEYGTRQ